MNAHELATVVAEAMDSTETPAWTWHDGPTDKAVKAHIENDDECWSYVDIDGEIFSLMVQKMDG